MAGAPLARPLHVREGRVVPTAHRTPRRQWPAAVLAHPVRTLLVLWAAQLAYLGVLQLAGQPYGFAVWPMGEDRNWVRFMLDAPGFGMMKQFWQMNDRNPLSPWWYWLFAAPIVRFDSALYLARKSVDPVLAVAATLLLGRLLARGSAWPLVTGVLVLACTFNGYREQIVWNFLLALSLALLAAWLYVVYVDSRRTAGWALGAALMLYFVSIATYTLEIGMLLAVGAVALWFDGANAPLSLVRRVRRAVPEVLLFAAAAVLFVAIWYTVARPSSTYYHLDLALVRRQFVESVVQLLWHADFSYWLGAIVASPSSFVVALPVALPYGAVVFAALAGARATPLRTRGMAWVLVVLAAVALPVVALESTSDVWLPGFRSRMIYQLSAPLLLVLLAGAAGGALAIPALRRSGAFASAAIAALATVILVTASIAYNRDLVQKTAQQRQFGRALARVASEHPAVHHFLVRYATDPRAVWGSDALSDTYARTILRRPDVTMRLIPFIPVPDPAWSGWWRLHLRSDAEGVAGAAVGRGVPVPYADVLFVEYDGADLRVPALIDADWFRLLDVDWQRDRPIVQAAPAFECPASVDFSQGLPAANGWSVVERQPDGSPSIWMNAADASLRLPTRCSGPAVLRLLVTGYMSADILDGLAVAVDGRATSSTRRKDAEGRLFVDVPLTLPPGDKQLDVKLSVPRTIVPAGGDRTLAVMFGAATLLAAGER